MFEKARADRRAVDRRHARLQRGYGHQRTEPGGFSCSPTPGSTSGSPFSPSGRSRCWSSRLPSPCSCSTGGRAGGARTRGRGTAANAERTARTGATAVAVIEPPSSALGGRPGLSPATSAGRSALMPSTVAGASTRALRAREPVARVVDRPRRRCAAMPAGAWGHRRASGRVARRGTAGPYVSDTRARRPSLTHRFG
jgi:hypothetical protein